MRSVVMRRASASIIIVLLLAVVPTSAALDHVTFGPNRLPPLEHPVALTDEPAPELEVDLPPGTHYLLGASGTGTHSGEECASAVGQAGFEIIWVSEPLFMAAGNLTGNAVAEVVDNLSVVLQLLPAAVNGQAAPQPVAAAPIDFDLDVGWIRPDNSVHDAHPSWAASATATPGPPSGVPDAGVPTPLGVLPASVSLDVLFKDGPTGIEVGSRFMFHLRVSCGGYAAFNLGFGELPTLKYVYGSPSWGDVDSDDIPDEYDEFPDGTQWSKQQQEFYGTNWRDPNDTPDQESICPGFTIEQAVDQGFERDDPATCPGGGGFPWLILLIALLGAVLLMGAAFGAVTAVNRKVRMEVSHDGFQDIPQGGAAVYTLALTARGKEGEETPVELSLKGVPEDWSAAVEPSNLLLIAGENPEPVTATLRVTPPPAEEYEAEAVVTVTATPTDADGKTSPLKPGTAVKTKTIVNIDKEAPEGKKRKGARPPATPMAAAAPTGDESEGEEESGKRGFGLAFLKRKKKDEEPPAEAGEGTQPEEPASATPATAGAGKPDLAVGKMVHNPADFSEGDTVTTTVPVRNKGDAPVEGLMLRLYVNDERVDEKEVNLLPGATAEVTFSWTAQPDENRVRVRGGLKEA
jgi:hypothetical protein